MIRTILAALDDTPMAPSVLSAAVEVATRFDARVVVWRAIEPAQEYPAAAPTSQMPDPLPGLMRSQAQEALEKLVGDRPRVTVAPPQVVHGEPWRAIVEVGRALNADLIVIGSHTYRGWDRILGTTAAKVVNHADRNVLVVHERSL